MILERLKQYIDLKVITIAAFERSIGMSNASFGKSLKNGGAIGSDKLENILSVYTDLSPLWLMCGKGEMLCSDEKAAANNHNLNTNDLILQLTNTIQEQAETIGEQRREISELKRQLQTGSDADDATSPKSALA